MTTDGPQATPAPDTSGPSRRDASLLLVPALVGAGVAVTLGVAGRVHQPVPAVLPTLGLSSVLEVKVVLTTAAAAVGLFQLVSALAMWGKLPVAGRGPAWVRAGHRWSGTAAFLLTLPVAYQCLWAVGFQDHEPRVLAHSLFGCAFYGAFAAKVLVLRRPGAPAWAVPVVGATLLVVLVSVWCTSALWFLTTVGFA